MKVTNKSDTRQPVHTVKGVVFIGAGKTRDVELTPEGEKLVSASDVLETGARQVRKRAQKAEDAVAEEAEG